MVSISVLSCLSAMSQVKGLDYPGEFSLNMREKKFTERVVRYWNKFSRDMVESPPLEVLKSCFDMVLRENTV